MRVIRKPSVSSSRKSVTMYNLSIENQENYNNLLKWLMNYALAHHIGVSFTHELPPYAPPTSFSKPGKLILMNGNWKPMTEIPYSLAHEIGHVMLECPEYYHLMEKSKENTPLIALPLTS